MRQNIAGWRVAALTGGSGPLLHAENFPFVGQLLSLFCGLLSGKRGPLGQYVV